MSMLLQNQIASVIELQQQSLLRKPIGLEREMLGCIPSYDSFATVITGIRRCGKSTLMHQMISRHGISATYINFEDTRLIGFDQNDFKRLGEIIVSKGSNAVFLDEVQVIDKWEIFVRQMLDEGLRVYLTGSNASLLSHELGSSLTGRHLPFELFPFSYSEFTNFRGYNRNHESMMEYIVQGGFPEYLKTNEGTVLNQLLDDILVKDIAIRYGLRDVGSLKQLTVFLITNIGKPISGNSMLSLFGLKSNTTILEYLSYLENSYLFFFLPMFSFSVKTQIRNPKKVYCIDNGLITENSIAFTDDFGRRLENLVFIHLRRKTKELYYYKGKNECDFVVVHRNGGKELVQVCYDLNDMTLSREVNGLIEAMDFFGVDMGCIVTSNQQDNLVEKGKTIKIIPAAQYLIS